LLRRIEFYHFRIFKSFTFPSVRNSGEDQKAIWGNDEGAWHEQKETHSFHRYFPKFSLRSAVTNSRISAPTSLLLHEGRPQRPLSSMDVRPSSKPHNQTDLRPAYSLRKGSFNHLTSFYSRFLEYCAKLDTYTSTDVYLR
jgi:hypothetical protein